MAKKIEIEERFPGVGFVYIGENDRVVWQQTTWEQGGLSGEHIEVNNHSNWGEVSAADQKLAARALARKYDMNVVRVTNLSRQKEGA